VLAALGRSPLESYTATGEGIFTALDVIKSTVPKGSNGRRAAFVLLLSDGKSTAGRSPFVAAREAKAEGVPVYTVAIGTPHAVIEAQGQLIDVRVASAQLRQIARLSGGSSYVAGSLEDLTRVYGALNGQLQFTNERRDVTSRYLGWLVLMCLVSTVGGLFVASRWP
jgi:Ca-activated chloride channel family protein